jgi:hypothetical protein
MDLQWFGSLAPDPHSDKKLDPDPHQNQCGSTTMQNSKTFIKAKEFVLKTGPHDFRKYQGEYQALMVQCCKIFSLVKLKKG